MHINTLFPDSVIRKAEEDIAHFESKGHSSSACSKGRYHPYERPDKRSDNRSEAKSEKPAWKNIGRKQLRRAKDVLQTTLPDQPRASGRINDNYCLNKVQARLLAGSQPTVTRKTINSHLMTLVNFPVVKVVPTAPGPSQKKELSPGSVSLLSKKMLIKTCESVSCVTQLFFVKPVTNIQNVVSNLPVGARLQNFWET